MIALTLPILNKEKICNQEIIKELNPFQDIY